LVFSGGRDGSSDSAASAACRSALRGSTSPPPCGLTDQHLCRGRPTMPQGHRVSDVPRVRELPPLISGRIGSHLWLEAGLPPGSPPPQRDGTHPPCTGHMRAHAAPGLAPLHHCVEGSPSVRGRPRDQGSGRVHRSNRCERVPPDALDPVEQQESPPSRLPSSDPLRPWLDAQSQARLRACRSRSWPAIPRAKEQPWEPLRPLRSVSPGLPVGTGHTG